MRNSLSVLMIILSFLLPIGLGACDPKVPHTKEDDVTRPVISVLPDLQKQANAETLENGIPWVKQEEKYDIKIIGTLQQEKQLVSTVKGDWSYTVYQFSYGVTKVLEGKWLDKHILFFIEQRLPTPESGIMVKMLWPFRPEQPLIFKLRREGHKVMIVSMEMAE